GLGGGRSQVGMAAAGAGADDAELAVGVGLRGDIVARCLEVTDDLVVRGATGGASLGGGVVRGAVAVAAGGVGTDGDVAVLGKAPREFAVELIPAGKVVDEDDTREGTVAQGPHIVGVNLIAVVALDLDRLSGHAAFGCRVELVPGCRYQRNCLRLSCN